MFEGGDASGPELYFMVDDLEAAVARVRELGGEADEPQPTEGGRFSSCRDDQGARFGIWAPGAGGR
jgi:predicted enzyme related to lactoylglutathione lyase